MSTELRLETSVSATLDSSGTANAINIGPTQYGEEWTITRFGASGGSRCRLQVMRGNSFSASRQLDLTDRADGDTSETKLTLKHGEVISFWWTRGTAGQVMTCSIEGIRTLPGRRAY